MHEFCWVGEVLTGRRNVELVLVTRFDFISSLKKITSILEYSIQIQQDKQTNKRISEQNEAYVRSLNQINDNRYRYTGLLFRIFYSLYSCFQISIRQESSTF